MSDAKKFEKPERTSKYDVNRGCYMDADGNYVYTKWEKIGKKWIEKPLCTIPLGENGENLEWVIMLDRDDHNVDLQNRYQGENEDYGFRNQVDNTKAGDDEDMEDTDAWAKLADPSADIEKLLFAEEELEDPQVTKLLQLMEQLTESQINLIYDYFGARKQLTEICDEENAANGTNKRPQSVGNRKKKDNESLRKLFEVSEDTEQ